MSHQASRPNLVYSLIPARGGSKSILKKNLAKLNGLPLIYYSIRHSLACPQINRTFVSTDCPEIAAVAQKLGAEVPFLRPANISGDFSTDLEAFQHFLKFLGDQEGVLPDFVVHLRPTAPFRSTHLIQECIAKMAEDFRVDSVRTVIRATQNPFKMWTLNDKGLLEPLLKTAQSDSHSLPRQSLPQAYWQTATVDVIRVSTVLIKNSMSGENVMPVFIDPEWAIDIDGPEDLMLAEKLLAHNPKDFGTMNGF